jgi:hypothetical protein
MTAALTSLTYVVAPAYNDIEIVLMAFPTTEQAVTHLTGLGLLVAEPEEGQDDGCIVFEAVQVDGETVSLAEALESKSESADALRQALFAEGNYYGGCGECYSLYLVERPLGAPVVAFNLD